MSDSTLDMLRAVKGCGKQLYNFDRVYVRAHVHALDWADDCPDCARLLVQAIRDTALEEAAQACEKWAVGIDSEGAKNGGMVQDVFGQYADIAKGMADSIRALKGAP